MMQRTLFFTLVVLLAAITACASRSGRGRHPLDTTKFWKQYETLPDEKALAIAGDPVGLWVGGAAGGDTTPNRAKYAAIAECKKKRIARRSQQPCKIYAIGDKVVWVLR